MFKSIIGRSPLLFSGLLCIGSPLFAGMDDISVSGFLDMSYSKTEGSDPNFQFDCFEVNFAYGFENGMTAAVELQHTNNATDDITLEAAYVSLPLSESLSFKAGKFLCFQGFEAADAPSMYQNSYAASTGDYYGGFQEGISLGYSSDMVFAGLSVVENPYGNGPNTTADELGYEATIALTPLDGLTWKVFYLTDERVSGAAGYDKNVISSFVSYVTGGYTFAVEYHDGEGVGSDATGAIDGDGTGYFVLGNYSWNNGLGLTVRYSGNDIELAGVDQTDVSQFTISPNYSINNNLSFLIEYTSTDDNLSSTSSDYFAAELTATF